jgi:hypothetical protein
VEALPESPARWGRGTGLSAPPPPIFLPPTRKTINGRGRALASTVNYSGVIGFESLWRKNLNKFRKTQCHCVIVTCFSPEEVSSVVIMDIPLMLAMASSE